MEFDDIKKMINNLIDDFNDFSKKDKKTIKRTINSSDLKGVIDVSFDQKTQIPKENFQDKPLIKDYKYWILKLDRFYKNPAMRVGQLNVASLKMYANLCDSLENYLNKQGTTVARVMSKLRRENFAYDIYYTIYLIAENKVLSFYNPLYEKSPAKSYLIIENSISKEARNLVEQRANKLAQNLKAADKETRGYFNLTENNKVSLWWDTDGTLREKYDISKKEELAINQISKRNNVLWKNTDVVGILLDMYLFTLRNLFDNDDIDTSGLLRIMKPYKQSKIALDSILIISEKNIRTYFTFFNQNKADKAIDNLREIDDGKILEFVEKIQADYLLNLDGHVIRNIYEKYLAENNPKIKDYINYLENLDLDNKFSFLNKIHNTENFIKIMDALLKSQAIEDKITALYFIYKYDLSKKAHKDELFKIIREENFEDFISLVKANDLNKDILKKIQDLNRAKAKKISVDRTKIEISRDNLEKTVSMVNEFLDDEEDDTQQEESQEDVGDSSYQYSEILNRIIENGSISKDELNDFSAKEGLTANTYLGKVNGSLYDFISDQALLIEDGKVIIDPFYVEMVKEYLSGNKN